MALKFCQRCKTLMSPHKKDDEFFMRCNECGFIEKLSHSLSVNEKRQTIAVSKKDMQTFPVIKEKCKKCKNPEAYFWTVQTRSGDEAETKFFKCTKCEHTWREYR